MKTNRLYVYAPLVLLAAGCSTQTYGPYHPDYYPELPQSFLQRPDQSAPLKVAAADGRANFRPQAEPFLLCAVPTRYCPELIPYDCHP
jgi:hypothetical protein